MPEQFFPDTNQDKRCEKMNEVRLRGTVCSSCGLDSHVCGCQLSQSKSTGQNTAISTLHFLVASLNYMFGQIYINTKRKVHPHKHTDYYSTLFQIY